MMLETEKSLDMPSANRGQENGSEGLRGQAVDAPGTQRAERSLPAAFCPVQALPGLRATLPCWGGSLCFTQATESNADLFPETPAQTHPEQMFHQLPWHPSQPS